MLSESKPKLIVITGPTGVGKSELSMLLAQHLSQPLFYFEPVLAYQELNIGSAKPTPEDRQRVVHYGLDLTDLRHPMTLVEIYRRVVPQLVTHLAEQGMAIVVTGSGFFLRALLQGVPKFHEHQPEYVRKDILFQKLTGHAYPTMGETVAMSDRQICFDALKTRWPKRAMVVHPHDIYRVLRSLEVAENMFEKYPDLRNQSMIESMGTYSLLPQDIQVGLFALIQDAPAYEYRLQRRVELMIERDWIAEVHTLLAQGLPLKGALKSVGYRELYTYLQAHREGAHTFTQKYELIEILTRAHRQLFRKQLRWFRRFPHAQWLNSTSMDMQKLMQDIIEWVQAT